MAERKYKSDIKKYKVTVKMSERDYEKLVDDAGKSNLNISGYIRELIRNGGKADTGLAEDRARLIRQVSGIATNINQVARRANEYRTVYYSDITLLQEYLMETQKCMKEVLGIWQSPRS